MKVICSIGPNVENVEDIDKFVAAGMDSMRLNFSHADYNKYKRVIAHSKEKYKNAVIIQDLQGNKLRVSPLFGSQVKVYNGEKVNFCSEDYYKKHEARIKKQHRDNDRVIYVPISIEGDFSRLGSSGRILMKDGTMEFNLNKKHTDCEVIETTVLKGGVIRGKKGFNAPGMNRDSLGLTSKDIKDIVFGIQNRVDVICLSYVTTAEDIIDLKRCLKSKNKIKNYRPKIWAKIECAEGIENFDDILKEVDGVMIGRGDLLSEIPLEDIPRVEDAIIRKTIKADKEIVVATYILESMKIGNIPTIPEAEAIYSLMQKNVTGIMLAGEVGVGRHPVRTIEWVKHFINKNLKH